MHNRSFPHSLGSYFLDTNKQNPSGYKSKNEPLRVYQTKKLMHSKENSQQNKKEAFGMGVNICKAM